MFESKFSPETISSHTSSYNFCSLYLDGMLYALVILCVANMRKVHEDLSHFKQTCVFDITLIIILLGQRKSIHHHKNCLKTKKTIHSNGNLYGL